MKGAASLARSVDARRFPYGSKCSVEAVATWIRSTAALPNCVRYRTWHSRRQDGEPHLERRLRRLAITESSAAFKIFGPLARTVSSA